MNISNELKTTSHQTQAGVTLIFSLLILLMLTMLGITSMQNARTQLSMAGNLREANLTFHAAEAGLGAGQLFVDLSGAISLFAEPDTGLYSKTDADPDYRDSATWNASQDPGLNLEDGIASPRFIVKYLGDRAQNEAASINIGGYSNSQPGRTISYFRITARGIGQSGNTRRYIQSHFGREY